MCLSLSRSNMNPIVASLLEFNQAFDIPKLDSPDIGPDALADIGYILAGTILNHGMQNIYDDAFDEVHRSNMAKLVDGKVLRREDGKVMKPQGWTAPQLAQFVIKE